MTDGHQLRLYNSLGRQLEDFVPSADPSGMYSCGPTVYAFPHTAKDPRYGELAQLHAERQREAARLEQVPGNQQELAPDERHAIEQLVAERTQARKERDWARADRIRAELDERGVQVTDTPQGPVWQLR